jgi:ABC-type nitrate/sulfonate/bicarbonate transport system substrate-binding protein
MITTPTRRRIRATRWLALGAAFALVAAACGGDDDTADDTSPDTTAAEAPDDADTPAPPAETLSINIASDGFALGTQSWVAIDQGYFERHGVEASMQQYGTGIEAIQAVIARQADIGPALDFAVLNLAAAAGENMNVVAGIAAPNPGFHRLVVREGIEGPADLAGTRIGYVEGTSEHFVTEQYLIQNDVPLDDVELIPLPGLFELVGALRSNDIDASWLWAQGVDEALEDPSLVLLTDDSEVLDTVSIFLVTGAEWAAANEELLERLLLAYADATGFVQENPDEAAEIVADAVQGDADTLAGVIPNQRYEMGFTQVQLDAMDSIAQFLIDSGRLPADFDIRGFLNLEVMERVLPGSVTADLG